MVRLFRSVLVAAALSLFLGFVAWTYLGDVQQLAGDSGESTFYPPPAGPYPAQYLPVLAVIPAPTVPPPPPPPLHVGLELGWEGEGYINFEGYHWNPGTHERRQVDQQVDADTVRVSGQFWYAPNPFDWPAENWYCHYNTSTQVAESCSGQDDPAWKWSYPWILSTEWQLVGGTITIDGQVFTVTGPHSFVSGYGETAYFWRMVNRDRFLIHHNGDEWKQYVEKGDAVMFYEYGGSGILLYNNVKRTWYRNDNWTGDNVRYESLLTQYDGRSVAIDLTDVDDELKTTATQGVDEIAGASTDVNVLAAQLAKRGIASGALRDR